jgi:hypothetical protein
MAKVKKLTSEILGGTITVVYVCAMVAMVWYKVDTLADLKLNEIGDFLAGIFGPIAFLWLVLGYLQQGRELRLSSEALLLQASELKASVEQQAIMAKAATDQLRSQQSAFELQVWRHEQEISPQFTLSVFPIALSRPDRKVLSVARVQNKGRDVRFVNLKFEAGSGMDEILSLGDLKKGGISDDVEFYMPVPSTTIIGRCFLGYLRVDGRTVSEEYVYELSSDGGNMKIERAAPGDCLG